MQLANKHMKICSTSNFRVMKLKQDTTTHLLEWPKSITDNTKCWQGYRAVRGLVHCWWKCKMAQPLLEDDLAVSCRLNIPLSYDPAITLCGVYLKEVKT